MSILRAAFDTLYATDGAEVKLSAREIEPNVEVLKQISIFPEEDAALIFSHVYNLLKISFLQ